MGLQKFFTDSKQRLRVGIKKRFLTGLAALLPLILTIYVIVRIITFIHEMLGRHVQRFLPVEYEDMTVYLTFPVAIILVLLVGFILATFIGRKIYVFLENSLRRIPVINTIYSFVKQVFDFFLQKKDITYNRVVAVQYPRKGIYSLGFVTGNGIRDIHEFKNEELVTVFVPSSPTPVTGYTIILPRKDVIPVGMNIEETFRFAISAGVIPPLSQKIPDPLDRS